MVVILQHTTFVKYQIFGMALEIAERLFQRMCYGERERKRANPRGFRGCDAECETATISPCISVLGMSFKTNGG